MRISMTLLVGLMLLMRPVSAAEPDARLYELRIETAAEGKWDPLLALHREHTAKLLAKHGITSIAYWKPLEGDSQQLYSLLRFPDATARAAAWKNFLEDPEWKAAHQASEAGGKLVGKLETRLLTTTDFSPALELADQSPRVFELRTYTATTGNLAHLLTRFRAHTVGLFAKHGITNVVYWVLAPREPHEETTLIYLLAHKDRAAAKASFAAFGQDPAWQEARKASEVSGGGPLTTKGGVQSVFLQPLEFSPLK